MSEASNVTVVFIQSREPLKLLRRDRQDTWDWVLTSLEDASPAEVVAGGRKRGKLVGTCGENNPNLFKQHLASILGMSLDFKMIFISWRYFAGFTWLAIFWVHHKSAGLRSEIGTFGTQHLVAVRNFIIFGNSF